MTAVRILLAGLLTAVALVALTPAASYACYCMTSSPRVSVEAADAVFVGTLVHLEPPPEREVMSSIDPNTFTFDVARVLRGDVGRTVEVQSAMLSDSCGWEGARVGEDYVVFASRYRAVLRTYLCSGNRAATTSYVDRVERVTGPGHVFPPDIGPLLAPFGSLLRFLS